MCRTFISHLAKENIQIDMFPKSQQVTYRYYLGRYYLFESQVRKVWCYSESRETLDPVTDQYIL